MKPVAEKLRNLERQLAEEKGLFSLFALFLREDAPNKWDVVVSAPWVDKDKGEALAYLAKSLQSSLSPDELLSLSRIVLVEQDNPGLDAILRAVQVEHSIVDVRDCNFFGLDIKYAYIITSQRLGEPVVREAG